MKRVTRVNPLTAGIMSAMSTIALVWLIGCAAAQAGDHCFYKGTIYSDGASACQAGSQYRCFDGDWRSVGGTCPDSPVVASRTCEFGGIAFSTGAASCQAGSQYRCEDGAWRGIGMPCTLGDSPIKVGPSGRTCMFGGATVANGSTICQATSTYLCNDGAWVNLGTLCR